MPYIAKYSWKHELPKIKAMGLDGKTMSYIAAQYGVSRQRIKQVIDRYIPDWHEKHGKVVVRQRRAQAYLDKWGDRQTTELYQIQRLKFSRKKANAKQVGMAWEVPFGDFHWPTHCPILGIEINYYAEKTEEGSPSFDRVDNTLGYVKGNVHVISWRAHRIKNDGTAEEHYAIAKYLDKGVYP